LFGVAVHQPRRRDGKRPRQPGEDLPGRSGISRPPSSNPRFKPPDADLRQPHNTPELIRFDNGNLDQPIGFQFGQLNVVRVRTTMDESRDGRGQ